MASPCVQSPPAAPVVVGPCEPVPIAADPIAAGPTAVDAVPALLGEPGILLRMTSPLPADTPLSARGESLAALAMGIVLASACLWAAAIERELLPFGEHGRAGWWTVAALAGCVAAAVRPLAKPRRRRAVVAAIAAFALAAAALARAFAAPAAAGTVLPVAIAIGCILALGTPPLRCSRLAPFAAAIAAAFAFAWAWPRFAGGGAHVVCPVATLLALPLAARVERGLGPRPAVSARWRHAAGTLARGAAVAVAAALLVLALAAVAAPSLSLPGGEARVLATRGELAAVYVRASQELRLYDGAALVDAGGPDRTEGPLAQALLHALARTGDRVLVLGVGGGRTAAELQRQPRFVVDCVDWRPDARDLRAVLAAHGPVPVPRGAAVELTARCAGLDRALAALGDGVRQAILLAEPLGARSRPQIGAQHELRRVAGAGLLLQLVALDRTPPRELHELFAAAAAAHEWNGLFVAGDGAVLASAPAPPEWSAATPFAAWSDDARWTAHAAHVGGLGDLGEALLGTLVAAEPPPPEGQAAGRAAALGVLRAWLRKAPAPAAPGEGVLARWTALRAEVRAASARVRELADSDAARALAQADAARFLPVGAPSAELQAALGLPAADGTTLLAPGLASRRAHALDPTFFRQVPPVCAALPRPAHDAGALEDLCALPPGPRLAASCTGDDPLAVALRVRFPSRCARALVERLAAEPLGPPAMSALRELADPFVLATAAHVLAVRGSLRELLGLWRHDLVMPPPVAGLLAGDVEDRRALAAALRGRREPSCHPVLAALLEGDDIATLRLAGEALWHSVGERVPFDAGWPLSRRREAAERLRTLHNRAP